MSHPTVLLGDGLRTSAQGFGAMALTPVYGGIDQKAALRTLLHAVDVGVTLIDTANVYGQGGNEELIAGLLRDRRDDVTVATKFGIAGNHSAGGRGTRGDPEYVRQCIDESLKRLGTEHVDLYYLHRLDPATPIEETVGAMAELVAAGKVRHLGLSEVTADELRRAHTTHPIAAVQSEWSIWSRDVEARVVPAAAELGVGFVPYSPLGRGFLTGTITAMDSLDENDFRRQIPRFADDSFDQNQAVAQGVATVAAGVGATPAQVALAWLTAQGRRFGLPVVPIPGTRRPERVDENAAAVDVTLSDDHLAALDALADVVQGSRSRYQGWVSTDRE